MVVCLCEKKGLFIATAPRKITAPHPSLQRVEECRAIERTQQPENTMSGYKNYSEFKNKNTDK